MPKRVQNYLVSFSFSSSGGALEASGVRAGTAASASDFVDVFVSFFRWSS
jgi:hypothetical protein